MNATTLTTPPSPSDCCPDDIAIDISVTWEGVSLELTLMPSEGHAFPSWAAWGSPEHWCSDPHAVDDLDALEGYAAEIAERHIPCPQEGVTNAEWRAALDA